MEKEQACVGKRVLAHVRDSFLNSENRIVLFEGDVECVIRELGQRYENDSCMLRIVDPSVPRDVRIGWRKYSDIKEMEDETHA